MDESEKQKILDEFLEMYGDSVPNPDHYPRIFTTMFKHFMYNRSQQSDTKEQS